MHNFYMPFIAYHESGWRDLELTLTLFSTGQCSTDRSHTQEFVAHTHPTLAPGKDDDSSTLFKCTFYQ